MEAEAMEMGAGSGSMEQESMGAPAHERMGDPSMKKHSGQMP